MTTPQGHKYCVECRKVKFAHQFSKVQLKKPVSKCSECILKANPKATPAGGNQPPKNRYVPVPSSNFETVPKSPFDDPDTFEVIDVLQKSGKMRSFVPMTGVEVLEDRWCQGCGRTTKVKLFGERFICKICEKMAKELNLPLDMTLQEKKDLKRESDHKTIAIQLSKCEGITEMAFLIAKSEEVLKQNYDHKLESVKKYYEGLE